MLQAVGWGGLYIVSLLSLNLGYSQFEFAYLAHGFLQSLVGVLISWPLRRFCTLLWDCNPVLRFTGVSVMALILAIFWTIARLQLFMLLTDETGLFAEFGGWLFPSIFIFLTWVALYHSIKYYQLLQQEHYLLLEQIAAQRDEENKRSRAEARARDAQLRMLRYQLNPHFLFNTMNSISSLVTLERNNKALDMIGQLGHFLRYSLANDPDSEVSLHREIEALRMYLKIEQSRFGARLQVIINLQEGCEDLPIPSLILQPLVENSIKYAIALSDSGGTILIDATQDDGWLTVEVADSGCKMHDDSLNSHSSPEGTGLGLKNTKERLEAVYGDNFDFSMKISALGGLSVVVKIPTSWEGFKRV